MSRWLIGSITSITPAACGPSRPAQARFVPRTDWPQRIPGWQAGDGRMPGHAMQALRQPSTAMRSPARFITPARKSAVPVRAGLASPAFSPAAPIARRHVEQDLLQAVARPTACGSPRRGRSYGKQELDRLEARPSAAASNRSRNGCFVEHHGQVGTKARHGSVLPSGVAVCIASAR